MNSKFLMNPHTGSVDTEANWKADMASWETTEDGESPQQQFDALVEVQQADDGGWVETSNAERINRHIPAALARLAQENFMKVVPVVAEGVYRVEYPGLNRFSTFSTLQAVRAFVSKCDKSQSFQNSRSNWDGPIRG